MGEFFGLFNNPDSCFNSTIKNLQQQGLNENTYSSLNRCFQRTILD